MAEREQWKSRLGFILAAVGSAVGLGNIWRFPYEAAANGGAAFLLVDIIAILAIGLPAMLVEFSIGRRARKNVVDAYGLDGHKAWKLAGALALFTGFWILSYYSVVGGWVIRYLFGSLTGAYFADPSGYFGVVASGYDALAFAGIFLAIVIGIVALGVERGIELGNRVMVPSVVLMMVGLAIWAATLPGAGAGYEFFLQPDFGHLAANWQSIVPAAVGEVLFTLSLGMGAMITYSSYIDGDESLVTDGLAIVTVNTFIGVLAGLVVFPLLFAQGIDPGDPGPGAIFISVATAFESLPAGNLLGALFYAVVLIAAISSAISLLEVVVSYFVDNYDIDRRVLSAGLGFASFLIGIPTALNTGTLGTYDSIASSVLLPLGVFLATLYVGWVYGREAIVELSRGTKERLPVLWLWHVRISLLAAVLMTLVLSFTEFFGSL
ncbi:sodium-dependent transporter [Haladaptatus sp. CMSO5]|uniref:sodium-dependent transporter n=1 Tax=Haladaptatus sp. CMSO5 TaxID=3120514 RepID=UPI002FCE2001